MTIEKKWRTTGAETMRKILYLLIMLMLMTSIISLAVADEAEDNPQGIPEEENGASDQNNETEHEIEIMNTSLGAEIRLLQLEKAIITNLLKGTMAVQVLQGLGVNTTQLEVILSEMRDVLAEVRAADPVANNSVQVFVELKNESRTLTKQFRDTIRALLDHDTINRIREQLRNMTHGDIQNCSVKIRNRIRQFNRNQLHRLYGIIGETNTTLINEYLNGNITLNQTKLQLHRMINQMTKEKRYMIFSEIKQENIKKKIQAHTSAENIGQRGRNNGHGKQH
ncbi:MAG: hypothetical protein V1726_00950 [Methanobacteriota archaeon]